MLPPSPSSLTMVPACARRPLGEIDHLGRGVAPGRPATVSMPASAQLITCMGFFLAAMMPLNDGYRGSLIFSTTLITAGRVPCDRPVAVLGLAVDRDRRPVDLHLARPATAAARPAARPAWPPSSPVRASVDSAPQHHQVEADLLQHLGQRVRGLQHVRPGQRVVQQVHGLVRAHRQRLADRLSRLLRAHGQHRDLALVRLLDLQRLPRWRTHQAR